MQVCENLSHEHRPVVLGPSRCTSKLFTVTVTVTVLNHMCRTASVHTMKAFKAALKDVAIPSLPCMHFGRFGLRLEFGCTIYTGQWNVCCRVLDSLDALLLAQVSLHAQSASHTKVLRS